MSSERLRIAVAACLLLLSACGSEPAEKDAGTKSSSVPKNLTKPATGPVIKGPAYSFKAPKKWRQRPVAKAKSPAAKAEVAVVDSTDSGEFTDNITVTRQPGLSEFRDIDALAESAKAGLEVNSVDATGIAVGKPVKVDGVVAATLTATLKNPDAGTYDIVQYYIPLEKTGYVVTFSFSIDKPTVEQNRIAQSVAATWAWAQKGSKEKSGD